MSSSFFYFYFLVSQLQCFTFFAHLYHPLLPHWTLLSSVFLSLLIFPVYVFLSVRLLLCPVSPVRVCCIICVFFTLALCVSLTLHVLVVSHFFPLPVPLFLCFVSLFVYPRCCAVSCFSLTATLSVQCVQFCFPVSLCIIHSGCVSAVFPLPSLPSHVCMVSVFLVSLVGSSAFLVSCSEFPVPCSMFSIYCLVLVRPV